MHIPDGFINNNISAGLIAAAIITVSYAIKQARVSFLEKIPVLKTKLATFPNFDNSTKVNFQNKLSRLGQEKIWRLATVGAFIFATQMINFPIINGTPGHLLGGVLAALIVGPFEALIVISIILTIQALMFGDGGVIALGANIVNMGLVGATLGYYIFKSINNWLKNSKKIILPAAFVAAWLSVVLASSAAAIEIALSGTKPLLIVLPAMTFIHLLIGLIEGLITIVVIKVLLKNNFPLFISESKNNDK